MKAIPNAQCPHVSSFRVERSAFGVQSSSPTPKSSLLNPPFRGGFTLFELLAVITIIGLVLSLSLGSFHGWGDAQAVRGSAEIVEAALEHARDYAVTQRVPVSFEYLTGIDATNGIKKIAEYRIVQEASIAAATNSALSAEDNSQLLGSVHKLPGGVWLVPQVPLQNPAENASDRFVFLPNGKVCNPQTAGFLHLFVVSRKMRGTGNTPKIIYQIDLDPVNSAVTSSKRSSEEFSP